MKIFLILLSALLLAGCTSTGSAKKPPKREDVSTESGWKKFMAKQEEEDKRFHRMDSRQLDKYQVFPWREGGRRSETIYENRNKSVFTDGWW